MKQVWEVKLGFGRDVYASSTFNVFAGSAAMAERKAIKLGRKETTKAHHLRNRGAPYVRNARFLCQVTE